MRRGLVIEAKDTRAAAVSVEQGITPEPLRRFPVAGATVGFQWFFQSGFATSLELGFFYASPTFTGPLAGYSIGWAF